MIPAGSKRSSVPGESVSPRPSGRISSPFTSHFPGSTKRLFPSPLTFRKACCESASSRLAVAEIEGGAVGAMKAGLLLLSRTFQPETGQPEAGSPG